MLCLTAASVRVPDAAAMHALGVRLARLLAAGDVLVVAGELGAGKTTLAQGVGEGLDVRGPVISPTFVISRIHPSLGDGPALVHVDAYRLGDAAEVEDLDLDETLAGSVTYVEWGEGKAEGLSDERLDVHIARSSDPADDTRVVAFAGHGERWRDAGLDALEAGDE